MWEERGAATAASGEGASRATPAIGASVATGASGFATRVFRTRLPLDYAYFSGHFPGEPVLAGVVQLHELVLPCVRRALPGLLPPKRLAGLKFLLRILPGDELDVTLRRAPAAMRAEVVSIDFEIARGGSVCATGSLDVPVPAGGAAP
ncbi:MAG TPA: hypothetical protein VK824_08150 [Planctomycetota bacterium]|nr:hypothetical protein [Planctomycetota bacterium]